MQKKFGIEVRTLNQKTLKQRSEEMQDRFKFGQPFQGSALFGAMSREQEERQREALMRSGLKISALMFWASKIICIAVGIMVGVLIGTKLSGLATIAAGGLGGMVGYILPELYLLQKRREWRNNIERELPNALDLMSISMAAGSTFDDAVRTVAENSEGALAEASATYWPTPASWISPMRSSSSPPMPACSRSPSSWPPLSRHARPEPSSSRCSRISSDGAHVSQAEAGGGNQQDRHQDAHSDHLPDLPRPVRCASVTCGHVGYPGYGQPVGKGVSDERCY